MKLQKSPAAIPLGATIMRDRKIARKCLDAQHQHADLFSACDEVQCLQSSHGYSTNNKSIA